MNSVLWEQSKFYIKNVNFAKKLGMVKPPWIQCGALDSMYFKTYLKNVRHVVGQKSYKMYGKWGRGYHLSDLLNRNHTREGGAWLEKFNLDAGWLTNF